MVGGTAATSRATGEPYTDTNKNGRWDSCYLAGYGINRRATDVLHDLWARSIVIRTGGQTVALCALNLVGYMIHRVARIKQTVLARARRSGVELRWGDIIIASTHNHHGPDTIGLWGPVPLISGVDPSYLDQVEQAAADAIWSALLGAEPAELRHASVAAPQAVRDIHPPIVTDPELSVWQARRPGARGKVIATLTNFAAHPELLDSDQTGVSPDFPHFLCQRLEQRFGGIAAHFSGALGGMQTPPNTHGRGTEAIAKIGGWLATAAIKALQSAKVDRKTHLFAHTELLLLPIENPRFRLAFRIGLFGKGLRMKQQGKALLLPSEISILRLGTAEFVTNPGELYPEIGNQIKKRMKGETRFIIGLSSNEIGYILPATLWGDKRYPRHRYEESMSLGRRTGPLVRKRLEQLTTLDEKTLAARRRPIQPRLEKLLRKP